MTPTSEGASVYATAAQALLNSGLGSPLPLPAGQKFPPPKGWTGAEARAASGADVAEWVQAHPHGNVALRLADGVVGIDVDGYSGKAGAATSRQAQAALGDLPATFMSTSRDDGVSAIRFYRVPPGTVLVGQLATAGFGRDVEVIQRHHRYAVVAPSRHPAGGIYRWLGPDGVALHDGEVPSIDDLSPLPDAWVSALAIDARRAGVSADVVLAPADWPSVQRTDPYVQSLIDGLTTDTPAGVWHDWLYNRCCRLNAAARLGLITTEDLTRAQGLLVQRLHAAFPERGTTEPAVAEVARTFRDAAEHTSRQGDQQVRTSLGRRDSHESLLDLLEPAQPASAAPPLATAPSIAEAGDVEQPASTWARIDLTAYLDGTHKPQKPELLRRSDGVALLYAGRVHSFHGESESGKSWAGLVAARACLTDGQRVVMLDYESDAATVVSRLLLMGTPASAIAEHFDYLRPEAGPNASEADRAAWFDLLSRPAALAIIDGVTEALATVGRASIDNDEITQWVRELPRRIAQRTGAAVVMVDHVTKDADNRGRFAIGGQAKMAALDGAAYVVEVLQPLGVGLRGCLALRVGKDRPGMVRPHAGAYRKSDRTQEAAVLTIDSTQPGTTTATLDPPRSELSDTSAAQERFRPTTLMQRVSAAAQIAGEPLSRNALAGRVSGKKASVLQAIDVLLEEGHLVADGPPKNGGGATMRLARPYSETDDLIDRIDAGNGSTSSQTHTPTQTRSRSIDREAGTGLGNGSNPFPGTGGNGSGTGRHDGQIQHPHHLTTEHRGAEVA
ncbi:MAG: bifunctional DNA primase/polymerase [Quadrisphaera sp.]